MTININRFWLLKVRVSCFSITEIYNRCNNETTPNLPPRHFWLFFISFVFGYRDHDTWTYRGWRGSSAPPGWHINTYHCHKVCCVSQHSLKNVVKILLSESWTGLRKPIIRTGICSFMQGGTECTLPVLQHDLQQASTCALWVWRTHGECYTVYNFVQYGHFGGGSVMFWAVISIKVLGWNLWTLLQWDLVPPGTQQCLNSCGKSMQGVPGGSRNWLT